MRGVLDEDVQARKKRAGASLAGDAVVYGAGVVCVDLCLQGLAVVNWKAG